MSISCILLWLKITEINKMQTMKLFIQYRPFKIILSHCNTFMLTFFPLLEASFLVDFKYSLQCVAKSFFIVSIDSKRCPRSSNFNRENRKKSHGTVSDEYSKLFVEFLAIKLRTRQEKFLLERAPLTYKLIAYVSLPTAQLPTCTFTHKYKMKKQR